MSRAPPLILMGGEDEEDGAQGVCVTPPHNAYAEMHSHTQSSLYTAWRGLTGQVTFMIMQRKMANMPMHNS